MRGASGGPRRPRNTRSGKPWPAEDQMEDVLDILWDHRCGRYAYQATDRELRLMATACAAEEVTGDVRPEDLPEGVREYFERMDPREQPAGERYLYEKRRLLGEPAVRERVRLHREKVRAFEEESKRRDRVARGEPPILRLTVPDAWLTGAEDRRRGNLGR